MLCFPDALSFFLSRVHPASCVGVPSAAEDAECAALGMAMTNLENNFGETLHPSRPVSGARMAALANPTGVFLRATFCHERHWSLGGEPLFFVVCCEQRLCFFVVSSCAHLLCRCCTACTLLTTFLLCCADVHATKELGRPPKRPVMWPGSDAAWTALSAQDRIRLGKEYRARWDTMTAAQKKLAKKQAAAFVPVLGAGAGGAPATMPSASASGSSTVTASGSSVIVSVSAVSAPVSAPAPKIAPARKQADTEVLREAISVLKEKGAKVFTAAAPPKGAKKASHYFNKLSEDQRDSYRVAPEMKLWAEKQKPEADLGVRDCV